MDAKATNISAENRFDAAYKAIMQCAMAGLWTKGYRTTTQAENLLHLAKKRLLAKS